MFRSRAHAQEAARAAEQRVRALARSQANPTSGWVPDEPSPTTDPQPEAPGEPEAPSHDRRSELFAHLGPDEVGLRRGAHRSTVPLLQRLREAGADRLPATLRGGVLRPSTHAVVALALVGVIAVAVGAWFAWQARPANQPPQTATVLEEGVQVRGGLVDPPPDVPGADASTSAGDSTGDSAGDSKGDSKGDSTATPSSPSPAGTASPAPVTEVVVHVAGRVLHPGVVHLPVGARVVDAIAAAGGATAEADPARINLARQLADGEQVLVLAVGEPMPAPLPGSPPATTGTGAPRQPAADAGPVNLNTATLADLDTLPGVGPVLAQRILDWRETNGWFTSVDELREITGVGEKRLADLRGKVTV